MLDFVEILEKGVEEWRNNKGIGTAIIPSSINNKIIVLSILQRVYARSPTNKTVIIVNNFRERREVLDFITKQNVEEENNIEFSNLCNNGTIRVFTIDYINQNNISVVPSLCIWFNVETICSNVVQFVEKCKFKLIVLNHIINDYNDRDKIYTIAPLLNSFKDVEVGQLRLSTPIEEYRIAIDIPTDSDDAKHIKDYNEYIATSIAIFGSLDDMHKAIYGDKELNISANQICSQIAYSNGWNEYLDMTIEINREIDALYNPISIGERACQTHEIIRLRNNYISDYPFKLDKIVEIIKENRESKILIINKRADFASLVTNYINNVFETDICLNYHDKVEDVPMLDDNGNPIVYKSGSKKGEPRMMGAQSQRTYAIKAFNDGKVNVISTNNTPDKNLSIDVDVIIITSPMCNEIQSYIYRLDKVNFPNMKLKLYSLYCKGTSEQRLIENKVLGKNHVIKNYHEDEIISDFVVRD